MPTETPKSAPFQRLERPCRLNHG